MSKAATEIKQDNRLVRYFKETRAELRKVHWPSRREARNLTLIVLSVTVLMGFVLGVVLDQLFAWLSGGIFVDRDPIRLIISVALGLAGVVALIVALRRQ